MEKYVILKYEGTNENHWKLVESCEFDRQELERRIHIIRSAMACPRPRMDINEAIQILLTGNDKKASNT